MLFSYMYTYLCRFLLYLYMYILQTIVYNIFDTKFFTFLRDRAEKCYNRKSRLCRQIASGMEW